jgi:oxygen-dependent protoporphyrinogen oxidase
VFTQHTVWPRAIPQYAVGYDAVKAAAERTERENPGFYLAGNYRNGVSVGDCIASGQELARSVSSYLARTN